ncbi:uncharacterized protein LOC111718359 [Eurytemora carolleeae]|uniref:uncharacterized protein LOC111718359 n=1 Tax=Eurytemora carolleeae TaxID=1294199 RepID=UPI000C789C8D|nr:uncharacterized protein LOC111718359 [Eurytemora carolleeae]|eukprot:XP_023349697.1 uncharacterized protein LOC111718359 [Eurytemora affinis]
MFEIAELKTTFNEVETCILALSQLLFSVLGTMLNNLILNTVKDTPGLPSSTYHVLLLNLSLCNLLVCSIVKPMSGIYISYAYARKEKDVGLEFCSLYTICNNAALFILPWSILVLAWQVFLSGRRAEERGLGVPRDALRKS